MKSSPFTENKILKPDTCGTFPFQYPRGVSSSISAVLAVPARCPSEPGVTGSARVLVVDDDKTSSVLAGKMLQFLGYLARFASNGMEAIDAFGADEYHAILMDLKMPLMDGFDAASRIREIEKASDSRVPIIALTAYVMPGVRERCLAAGMDDFLAKPFRKRELAAKLTCAVGRG